MDSTLCLALILEWLALSAGGTYQLVAAATAPPKVVDPAAEQPLLLVYPEKGKLKKNVLLGSAAQLGVLPRALTLLQQTQPQRQPAKRQKKGVAKGHKEQQEGEGGAIRGEGACDGEFLPRGVVDKHKLIGFGQALQQLHNPSSMQHYTEAARRLAFQVSQELFYYCLFI